jgi:hypothetical protein
VDWTLLEHIGTKVLLLCTLVNINDFELDKVIGEGAFGKVG